MGWGLPFLLVVFLIHLAAFLFLWIRKREWYHLAVVTTFTILVAATATRLFMPHWEVAGAAIADVLRTAAFPVAAFSIAWTLLRIARRISRRLGRGGSAEGASLPPQG